MLNRMRSDRRERNLRLVQNYKIVPEGGEPLRLFALFEDDTVCHIYTEGYAPLHPRLSIIRPLRGRKTACDIRQDV